MDEASTIHEKLTPILQEQLELTGYFYFGWVVVGLAAVLVVGLVYLPFVKRLPPRIRNLFILAAVLYVGGALVVESISANLWFHNDGTSLQFSAVGTLEEWMEMLGVITMIYAQLEYIRTEIGAVQLNVVSTAAEAGVKAGTAAAPWLILVIKRQREAHGRSYARRAFGFDDTPWPSTMLLAMARPSPVPPLLTRARLVHAIEAVEQHGQIRRGNAGTTVADFDQQPVCLYARME